MSKKNENKSKENLPQEINIPKPKPSANIKVDRHGSKTAPIEADFVII